MRQVENIDKAFPGKKTYREVVGQFPTIKADFGLSQIGTVVRDGTPCRCDFPQVCDTRVQEETVQAGSVLNRD